MPKNNAIETLVRKFIKDNQIGCAEDVYQSDHVIENAYEFIADLCEMVGYHTEDDNDAD